MTVERASTKFTLARCISSTLIAAALLVATACSATRYETYEAARPVEARLEIEVEGQWKTVHRTVYTYPEDDDE